MTKKLNINQKVYMVLSREKSLRDIGEKHGLHHSSVDDIYKESEEVLRDHWQEKSKRHGRPKKPEELKLKKQNELREDELEKELKLKQMRIDWLELQLKWAREREQETIKTSNKQLKKKKKKS